VGTVKNRRIKANDIHKKSSTKNLRHGNIRYKQTKEWRKLYNDELQRLFQKPNIGREIALRRLRSAGCSWLKQGTLDKRVIEEGPMVKMSLGRPKLRWEDSAKKEIKKIEPDTRWREAVEDRNRWQSLCFAVWS